MYVCIQLLSVYYFKTCFIHYVDFFSFMYMMTFYVLPNIYYTYIEILISHYEHFILHIFAFILCVICKYNFVSNGRSHYYPGSGCPRCKGVDFQIIYTYIYIYIYV